MRRFDLRLTFRRKLLLAFIGTLVPALLTTLLVVRHQADRQVDQVVRATMSRATEAFARVERIRQQQLGQLGRRVSNSNRWGAQLRSALEGDTAFAIEQTRYELGLAGMPQALAAYATLDGEAVTALAHDRRLPNAVSAIPPGAIDRIFAGDTAIYSYHVVANELFSIHPTILYEADQPIGVVFLGIPIDHEAARSLGHALGTEVCFFAAEHCIASSNGVHSAQLENFASIQNRDGFARGDIDDQPFALVKQNLPGAGTTDMSIVLAIPLADVISPFSTIQDAIQIVGIAMLLLAAVVALGLSRGLAQPIRELTAATARIAAGHYDTTVHVRSRDEIGHLAESFNTMTHGLLLKEKYRGVLDKVVSPDVANEMLKGEITLGGETREVTTLFADVRGFTAMSEDLEPQQVISLLNEVMERAEAAIVAEGGVVDKYVGDQIMAIFGAPVAHGDDAMRAIRAAVRIQHATDAVNELRRARGEPELGIGVGINTGLVVAGNMGSARRLNYTVLGAPVNLANRLCSEAASGQTLISDATLQRVIARVKTRMLGTRTVKGFATPVPVHELIGVEEDHVSSAPSLRAGAMLGTLLLLACAVGTARAQIQPSARLDVNFFAPSEFGAGLIEETQPFIAGRASVFVDAFAGDHLYGLLELRVDRGAAPSNRGVDVRIEQAFLRFTPWRDRNLHVQAGRFVSPFGNYPQRHHSIADPFIRPPLSYDYRTVLSTTHLPAANDGFLNWKTDPDNFRPIGSPPVWDAPYQLGAMLLGGFGRFVWRVAAMNSAPSSEPGDWRYDGDQLERLSFVAHAAYQLLPELRLGVSYNHGSYLSDDLEAQLPAQTEFKDFRQRMIGVELTATRGFVEVRGELLHDTWEFPRVIEHPVDVSYYVETKVKVVAGGYVAGRFGQIRFNEIPRSSGDHEVWDYRTTRWQAAAGYRFTETIDARAEYMIHQTVGPVDPSDNLFSAQLTWLIGRR